MASKIGSAALVISSTPCEPRNSVGCDATSLLDPRGATSSAPSLAPEGGDKSSGWAVGIKAHWSSFSYLLPSIFASSRISARASSFPYACFFFLLTRCLRRLRALLPDVTAHISEDCSRGISSIVALRTCCLRVVNKTQKLSIMFQGDGGNVCTISLLLSWVRCSSRRTLLQDDSLVHQAPTLQEHACRLADVLIGWVLSAVPKFTFVGLDMTVLSRTQDIPNTSIHCCPPCHTSAARQPRPL